MSNTVSRADPQRVVGLDGLDIGAALTDAFGDAESPAGTDETSEVPHMSVLKALLREAIEASTSLAAIQADTSPALVVAPSDVITVSFTVPTDAQDNGDVIAATQEVANFFRVNGSKTTIQSIVAIDTDDQGVAFDIVIMNANTVLGTEDSAPDIDDTEVLTVIGIVEGIGTSSASDPRYSPFIDLGGARVATRTGIGLILEAGAATTSAWMGLITRGTPTYASGVITVQFGILQD